MHSRQRTEADPDAKLFYNDYNIEAGAKHQNSMALLKRLIGEGVPIYGVGIQGHWSTTGTPYAQLDKAIADYQSLGLKVAISELDITIAGQTGGQLNQGGGGGGRRGRGGAGGGGAPGGPGAAVVEDGPFYEVAAPAAPAGPGRRGGGARGFGGGGGGFGGGGFGGGGPGRGAAPAPVNPASTIDATVNDLSADQKTKIAAVSEDTTTKLAAWQKSSQVALAQVQPQYSPGQVAYAHEQEEFAAEQTKQNGLRDDILNDAEAQLLAILTPAQAEKWESSRLSAQFTADFGRLNVTDDQKTKVDGITAESAKKLAAAKDKTTVADSKAEFTKNVMAVLDDQQKAQYQAMLSGGNGRGRGGGGFGGGGRGGPASAAGLKAQADAYARIFEIFEKHKETIDRVTFWGLNDARSWRAGQHALIFDENNLRKPDYQAIVDVMLHPDQAPALPQ